MGETDLATKCLEFCQTLSSQCSGFKFSLMVGTSFSFTLDKGVVAVNTQAKASSKKKASPSTIRRNARRREEFLQKKQSPAAVPARPLNILPSPTDSSGRRQVVSLGRDSTAPSFNQLDGAATASPPPESPSSQPPQTESHCQTVE